MITLLSAGCASTPQSQTENWTKLSDMSLAPDVEPESPWTMNGNGLEVFNVNQGQLTIQTVGTSVGSLTHPEERFDNNVGTTLEIKLKLMAGPTVDHDASLFSLQDGVREGKISFFNDRIEVRDQNDLKETHEMNTTGEFHIYRLVIVRNILEVFVDGEIIASITLDKVTTNKVILFGDVSQKEGENINAEIDYIAYSTEGAKTPLGESIVPDIVPDTVPDTVPVIMPVSEPPTASIAPTTPTALTAPTAPIVNITPASPQKSDDLTCQITTESTDPDGDPINYSYNWYNDGVLQPESTTNTIDSSYTEWGETWKCVVIPDDGLSYGSTGEDQVTIDAGMWTKFSGMKVSPEIETVSPWNVSFANKETSEGILTVETVNKATGFLNHPEERFDNNVGTTLEIKLKLLAGPTVDHDASLLSLQDGSREGKVSFFSDRIEIRDKNALTETHEMDTTDKFHIYRLVIVRDTFEVFVDGEIIASITLNKVTTNKVALFGDGSIQPDENIHVSIDYIAFAVSGAFAPEGEPIKVEGSIPTVSPD